MQYYKTYIYVHIHIYHYFPLKEHISIITPFLHKAVFWTAIPCSHFRQGSSGVSLENEMGLPSVRLLKHVPNMWKTHEETSWERRRQQKKPVRKWTTFMVGFHFYVSFLEAKWKNDLEILYAYIYIYIYIHMYVCMYVRMYVCMYVCICMYACMHMYVCYVM